VNPKELHQALENVRAILRTARAELEDEKSLRSADGKIFMARGAISGALDHLTEVMKEISDSPG
jgi:hypothetical protein